ncbi:2-C-methyl-D-erythritol 4-phosphate cytidylyltransferase [Pseudoduganella chitinolytica]|uniref:2-C-methyl-D-erythritol 4-phosphate cytidylyltransferase n=1 Tax=Pseudoduganella chitinolytica TaxID=34070 RepID=A0ABY8BCW0_9BURK|nr:2-C-methyl-D-erythritol 4-phosphate cytidylyltransferase [Pseudoduganella chitinolytica]WEF33655.1 2-C-methyl-D-erythritol 4-phosphate cytidylyltransferase [Pseudoduganella chitinolytica]
MTAVPQRYVALIPAAGVGARMAAASPKQYLPLAGKPMLRHTLQAFLDCAAIAQVYVVVSAADDYIGDVVADCAGRVTVLRCGGATRMESIRNGLRALDAAPHDRILVHDAARPGLTPALIDKLIAEAGANPAGGLLALRVVDTVKSTRAGRVETTPRDGLWLAQTPQMFPYELLLRALEQAPDPEAITDDASAVEMLGLSPQLVEGHPRNLKVTLPADIGIATMYLTSEHP